VCGKEPSHLIQYLYNIALRHFSSELIWVVSYQNLKDTLKKTSMVARSVGIHSVVVREDGISDSVLRDMNELNKSIVIVCNCEYYSYVNRNQRTNMGVISYYIRLEMSHKIFEVS
jgi:hypothetical protein